MTTTKELYLTSALLILALLIGGAGVNFPFLQMLLDFAGLGILGYFLAHPAPFRVRYAGLALGILGTTVLLGLLQLVPLPPVIWESLPGREVTAQLDSIIGSPTWRPIAFDVEGTVRALLVLIPTAAMFIGAMRLRGEDKVKLLWLTVALALFGAVLGLAQFSTGGGFTPYPSSHSGYPIGLFVNRNHQAALLLGVMPVVAAFGAMRLAGGQPKGATLAIAMSAIIVLAIVVIATTSRMALLLLPFVGAASLVILFARQSLTRSFLPTVAVLTAVVIAIWLGGGLQRNFSRFSSLSDARVDYWTDVKWALDHYGLAGTGYGSFEPIHKSAESLSTVSPAILNHAHNDYIEVLLEGGLPALLILGAFFALLGLTIVRLQRASTSGSRSPLRLAALVGIAEILVFSLVDYPLRMPAIASVFSLFVAVLMPSRQGKIEMGTVPRAGRWLGFAAIAGAGVIAVQAGMSKRLLLTDQPDYAAQWAPWSTEAQSQSATDALFTRHDGQLARERALAALRLSPIDAPAIRTLGVVEGLGGHAAQSAHLLQLSATLGWRDPVTNILTIGAAIEARDAVKAVQRAEALYRQHEFVAVATARLLTSPIGGQAGLLLTRDLSARPDWRLGFLRSAAQLPDSALPAMVGIVVGLNHGPTPVSMDEGQSLLDRLQNPRQIALRRELWLSLRRKALIANGRFDSVSTYRGFETPRDWDISDDDLEALTIDRPGASGNGQALRIYQANLATPLIAQSMVLPAGDYALSFKVRAESGGGQLRWSLRCLESGDDKNVDMAFTPNSRWRSTRAVLTVPNQNCANQRLALELMSAEKEAKVWLDDVTLEQR